MNKIAELEALLFQYGEPVMKQLAAKRLGVSERSCEKIISDYREVLKGDGRGLTLVTEGTHIQLVTKPETKEITERIMKEELKQELTPALLETLTIAAYMGPVSRSSIDYIRGVNSSMILRNAMVRGLVQRRRHKNTYLYSITTDFLKHLGLTSTSELPDYEKHRERLKETLNSE